MRGRLISPLIFNNIYPLSFCFTIKKNRSLERRLSKALAVLQWTWVYLPAHTCMAPVLSVPRDLMSAN